MFASNSKQDNMTAGAGSNAMATGSIGMLGTTKQSGNFEKLEQDYLPVKLPYKPDDKEDQEMDVEPMAKSNSIVKLQRVES